MFHFVEPCNGAAFWRCNLINFLLRDAMPVVTSRSAAPLAVWAAILRASCAWKPISVPPCDAARIERKKNAIPQAHNAVADVISSSFIWMLTPTVSNNDNTRLVLAADALSVAIHVMLWPIEIAVFGIARITCTSNPKLGADILAANARYYRYEQVLSLVGGGFYLVKQFI
jgi:hypothetical protein